MTNQILPEVKEKRSKKLLELSARMKEEYDKSCLGKRVEVLIEELEGTYEKGHTPNYVTVFIKKEKEERSGSLITAKIDKMQENKLIAIPVKNKN